MSSPQSREWIAAYARNLGIDPSDVEEFESDADPRPADAPTEPEREPTEDETKASTMRAFIEANPDPSTWVTTQLKAGLEWLIRLELKRRGLV